MKKIPIVSTVVSTVDAMEQACKQSNFSIISQQLQSYTEAFAAFRYEMPEIKIIDFGDSSVHAEKCLKIVKDDPWLLFGGVIAITDSQEQKATLTQRKEPNFLFVLTRKEFEQYVAQIIKILNRTSLSTAVLPAKPTRLKLCSMQILFPLIFIIPTALMRLNEVRFRVQ